MVVGRHGMDFVCWEFDSDALNQLGLVHNLSALVDSCLLGIFKLRRIGAFLQCYHNSRHIDFMCCCGELLIGVEGTNLDYELNEIGRKNIQLEMRENVCIYSYLKLASQIQGSS